MHGLVAANAPDSNPNLSWRGENGIDFLVNSTGNGIGAGKMNTSIIVSAQSAVAQGGGTPLSNMAAQVCVAYAVQADGQTACNTGTAAGDNCYGDWYLPSLYELNQMFLQDSLLHMSTNTVSSFMWSSTEYNETDAWRINVTQSAPNAFNVGKDDKNGAWCIRSF